MKARASTGSSFKAISKTISSDFVPFGRANGAGDPSIARRLQISGEVKKGVSCLEQVPSSGRQGQREAAEQIGYMTCVLFLVRVHGVALEAFIE